MPLWTTSAFGLSVGLAIVLSHLPILNEPTWAQDPSTDVSMGKAIYEQYCLKCHGAAGRGDGPQAQWQMVRPANFRSAASRSKSDEQLLSIITDGLIFSPMHAWGDRLTATQRHDVLAYIRLLAEQGR